MIQKGMEVELVKGNILPRGIVGTVKQEKGGLAWVDFPNTRHYRKEGGLTFEGFGYEATVWLVLVENLKSLQEHEKPSKWYENIPECGVLCWVYDFPEDENPPQIEIIKRRDNYFYDHEDVGWVYAKPFTTQEVQQLFEAVPNVNSL